MQFFLVSPNDPFRLLIYVKSRSLVIKKGQKTERFKLYVQNEEIPSIVANPIKCLGKWFDASLHDSDNVRKLAPRVEDGLKKIDRCGVQSLALPACLATKACLAIDVV